MGPKKYPHMLFQILPSLWGHRVYPRRSSWFTRPHTHKIMWKLILGLGYSYKEVAWLKPDHSQFVTFRANLNLPEVVWGFPG